MITVNLHAAGHRIAGDLPLTQISDALAAGDDSLLWVDVLAPTADDLRLLGEEFRFHPLAIEDAAKEWQRPKVDLYDGFLFIAFYALGFEDGRLCLDGVNLFVGRNYLVTVHWRPLPALGEVAHRWRESAHAFQGNDTGALVYSVLDAIVDGYFPVVDAIGDRIDELEDAIFDRDGEAAQQAIFELKKDLLAARRVIAPERDVMNVLVRRDSPIFGSAAVVYFQDIYDHILRVADTIDGYRDLLANALDAHLSVVSNRLNQAMKTLTASSIILMSMTLVASVYGMNFAHMPELGWRYGYPSALGLMAAIGVVTYAIFRRIDWL